MTKGEEGNTKCVPTWNPPLITRQTLTYKIIHTKIRIEHHELRKKDGNESYAPER
jgi:hypothetical protein